MTYNQITNLLSVAGFALHALTVEEQINQSSIPSKPEFDGGCVAAAESVFINACSRLDEILADKSRWDFAIQDALEKQLEGIYNQQTVLLKEQIDATREVKSPHYTYRPTLVVLHDGRYAAILGDIEKPETAIIGIGNSPKEAILDFDRFFEGDIPDHIIAFLADRAATLEKQNEQTDQNEQSQPTQSVDPNRDQPVGKAKKRRKKQ